MRKLLATTFAVLLGLYPAQADLSLTGVGGFAGAGGAQISLVQNTPGTQAGNGGGTSWSTTLNGTTAGNLLIVGISYCQTISCGGGSATTVTSVTSNQSGETCAQVTGAGFTNAAYLEDIWYCKNIHGGNDAITANFSAAGGFYTTVFLSEWHGASTTAPLDTPTVANNTSASTTSISVTTATNTAQTNELVYTLCAAVGGATVSSNQTNVNTLGGNGDAYEQAPTIQTYTAVCSWSGTEPATTATAAFKHP